MKILKPVILLLAGLLAASCASMPAQTTEVPTPPEAPAQPAVVVKTQPDVVTLNSPSPLVAIKIMVRAGSTADPAGKEGLAAIVGDALIEGGFGAPENPVTKEKLAQIVEPWGDGAMPGSQVAGRTTTFHIKVPKEVLGDYLQRVLLPMFTQPLFQPSEIDRLKNESLAAVSSYRYEDLENLGLAAIDEYVMRGTPYEHQPFGSETSIPRITREDVVRFYRDYYRPGNIIVGVSTSADEIVGPIVDVVRQVNQGVTTPVTPINLGHPESFQGRRAVVISEPHAPAAGVHLGFPLDINRSDPDFWPLYVANTFFGTHRDSFGRLYSDIRQERGYNYGDYSYIEHWTGKPYSLFQIFNQPREMQNFTLWIRPVAPEYAYFLAKAATWELDNLVTRGLTDDQVDAAKKKAKVLYLNLGETVDRLLAARMDDVFYGMRPGYLQGYLQRIDAVTPEQVNAAIRKHLQTKNIKYVIVTDEEHAASTVSQIRNNQPAYGKTLGDYEFKEVTLDDGTKVWQIPEGKFDMLRTDALWANYPLNIEPSALSEVPASSLFKTGKFVAE